MSDIEAAMEAGEQCFICLEAKSDAANSCPQHFTCQTCFEKELVPRTLFQQHSTSIHCSFPSCSFDYSTRLSPSAKEQLQRNRNATTPRKFCPKCTSQDAEGSLELGAFDKQTKNRLVLDCKQCQSHFCLFCLEEISPRSHRLAHWLRKFGLGHACKEESMRQLAGYVRDKGNKCKPCPHCFALVHRVRGCPHMLCKAGNGGCGNHFCFDCVSPRPEYHECRGMDAREGLSFRERARLDCRACRYSVYDVLDRIKLTIDAAIDYMSEPKRRLIAHLEERRLQAYFDSMRRE